MAATVCVVGNEQLVFSEGIVRSNMEGGKVCAGCCGIR